jgi:hypothetical protein
VTGVQTCALPIYGYLMSNIQGIFPIFSKDGKYLLFICDNEIMRLPVDLKEIYKFVYIRKLFGDRVRREEIWRVL